MALYSKGIILEQHKEPALSAPLVSFVNPQNDTLSLSRELPAAVAEYSIDDIIAIAHAAAIVDESDGRELALKLRQATTSPVSALVIDAVDDEPYVSSKIVPLIALRPEVLGGIALCKKIVQTEQVEIMIYRHITDTETAIPSQIGDYKITRMSGGYPARPSASQLRFLRKGTVLRLGVGSMVHLYRAVTQHKKQTTTFVTVHGNAVSTPMNLEVSFDMTVTQVLERCGLTHTPTRVVLGGPMTGFSVLDTDRTRMTPTTGAVLAFVQSKKEYHYRCIGCGRCERGCPVGLNPMYIHQLVDSGTYRDVDILDPQQCIGCGTCSYVCPSRLDVVGSIYKAKAYLAEHPPEPRKEITKEDIQALLTTIGTALAKTGRTIAKGSRIVGTHVVRGAKVVAKGARMAGIAIGKGAKVIWGKSKELAAGAQQSAKEWQEKQAQLRAEKAAAEAERAKLAEEEKASEAARLAAEALAVAEAAESAIDLVEEDTETVLSTEVTEGEITPSAEEDDPTEDRSATADSTDASDAHNDSTTEPSSDEAEELVADDILEPAVSGEPAPKPETPLSDSVSKEEQDEV